MKKKGEEKQETWVLLNFKYSVSPIRYGDLLHIWNYTKKKISPENGLRRLLGKCQRLLAYLEKKNRVCYKKLISQLDIREK
ncbi:hypothetical protein PVAP13_6NG224103 [Panicum virgatum]|uniref:Ribosomal protein S15 n=1 Tax=Panicum virgatum TaxID=38727 RepID=A0A8T0QZB1_PANVG|nr:hypothetical protein PVAP13_6NG224103 [Panicum virgatum]